VQSVADEVEAAPQFGNEAVYGLCHLGLRAFGFACRCRVTGREHVPAEGPVIVASNHISYADPPALALITRRPISFVAKEELFRFKPFAALIRALNAFPVRRGTADRAAIRRSLAVLRAGRVLAIFPEGMRSHDANLLQPELGIGMIALRSGAPIVPVGLIGTDHVMPRKVPVILLRRFEVRIGAPLRFDDLCARSRWRREDYEHVARTTMEAIAELRGQTFEWAPPASGADEAAGTHAT
jgi:1-acyl-sn-glycerol-3-phosphate acyltransferase